jgi:hypothetical protein
MSTATPRHLRGPRQRDDREFELVAEIELFEPDDRLEFTSEDRRTIVRYNADERVTVIDDRTFHDAEDQALIEDIRQMAGGRADTDGKKALEPITILTIAVTIVGTKIAEGFVGQIGGDIWAD